MFEMRQACGGKILSGRVLTLVVVVKDPHEAKQIWDKHACRANLAGCYIAKIQDGDAIKELDEALKEFSQRSSKR